MKKLLIVLLLISSNCIAQQGFQTGKYFITRNTGTTNVTPVTVNKYGNNIEISEIRNGTTEGQGQLLLTAYNKWFFYFNAIPGGGDITQIGTSGLWAISIPTTVNNNKAFFIPDRGIAIRFDNTVYDFAKDIANLFPLELRRISNNTLMCRITEDGRIWWPDTSVFTATSVGLTGLTQIQIN